MRILWDLRLFSYGYSFRGVGTYCARMCAAALPACQDHEVYVWADRGRLPPAMTSWPVHWIPYKTGSWRSDLFRVPFVALKHGIDLLHHWVALGPIHDLGMGVCAPCTTVATVHDLAVDLWNDEPFAAAKRSSWYWRTQKSLIRHCTTVFCNSMSTAADMDRVLGASCPKTQTLYVPLPTGDDTCDRPRRTCFVTLGGAPHKNLCHVITAFAKIGARHPELRLLVLGEIDRKSELPDPLPRGVIFENMSRYDHHLKHAAGMVFCSLHEGLGLPALEAMACGCPLLLSDIPSLREIADGAARFADPVSTDSIAEGMEELIAAPEHWVEHSLRGREKYKELSRNSGINLVRAYEDLRR